VAGLEQFDRHVDRPILGRSATVSLVHRASPVAALYRIDGRSLVEPLLSPVTVGYLELKKIATFPRKSQMSIRGTAFQGTTLLCLRKMHDLRSTITQVIALGE
jgi:hypothetical protein